MDVWFLISYEVLELGNYAQTPTRGTPLTDNETLRWIIPFKYLFPHFDIYVFIYNFWFYSKWSRGQVPEQILTFNSETLYLWSYLISCSNPKLDCCIGNEVHFLFQKDVWLLLAHLGHVHAYKCTYIHYQNWKIKMF